MVDVLRSDSVRQCSKQHHNINMLRQRGLTHDYKVTKELSDCLYLCLVLVHVKIIYTLQGSFLLHLGLRLLNEVPAAISDRSIEGCLIKLLLS